MIDMGKTIEPKSDQMNFDDFTGGVSKTVKITNVTGSDSSEQPVSIHYEGDNNKPYKPCKSMRRVLVHCWGRNAKDYIGRSLTLYGDPEIKFGGLAVGGIRISNMSHIDKPITMALTATRANKKPFTVKPLTEAPQTPSATLEDMLSDISTAPTLEGLEFKYKAAYKAFTDPAQRETIKQWKDKRKDELSPKSNED